MIFTSLTSLALKEKLGFPKEEGLYLNKNSFAVNEVTPLSKIPSKFVSTRSRLSKSNRVRVLVFGPTDILNDSSETIVWVLLSLFVRIKLNSSEKVN